MGDGSAPLCFTCGLPSTSTLQFNRLLNGQVCPACRDRLLDAIPAPLPRRSIAPVAEMGAGTTATDELFGDVETTSEDRPWPPPGLAS
jgi:hypothetical protein